MEAFGGGISGAAGISTSQASFCGGTCIHDTGVSLVGVNNTLDQSQVIIHMIGGEMLR